MKPAFERAAGLAAPVAAAFLLRVVFPWRVVFRADRTNFPATDPWYHVRLVENLLAHFPLPIRVDPYLVHPGVQAVPVAPGLDLLIAGIAWLLGRGQPPTRLVEAVAALVPPVLGALVVLPTYVFARAVAGRSAAWLAAALVAVLPGQLLERSVLGFADHHVAEVLSSAAVLALLATSLRRIESTGEGGATVARWRGLAIAAGACLALYRLFWASALMGILLLVAAFLAVALSARPRGGVPTPGLCRAFALSFAVAGILLLLALPIVPGAGRDALVLLAAATLAESTERIAGWARRRARPSGAFAGAAAALVAGALLASALAGHGVLAAIGANLRRLHFRSTASYVTEAQPLAAFHPLRFLWNELGVTWMIAVAGLVLLAWRARRQGRAAAVLLAVWTAGVTVAMAGQVRFAYYLAVPVAVLAALALAELASIQRTVAAVVVAVVLVCLLVEAVPVAATDHGPSDAWAEALQWMRHATPEPFADPGAYLARYDRARPPRSGYGVLAWWDSGYWITRIAHRVPIANPTQEGAQRAAAFLLAQDEASAERIAGPLDVGYVIVDRGLPVERPHGGKEGSEGAFAGLAAWSGAPADRYFELYDDPQPDGAPREVYLFYPEYYRSLAIRLFVFGGRAVPTPRFFVVTWVPAHRRGGPPKRIVDLTWFPHYRDAVNAVLLSPAGRRRLVGVDPLASCVPLEPLAGYRLVYASRQREPNHGNVPSVQVYRRGPF